MAHAAADLSTSNAGKFRDSCPRIPAAGKVITNPKTPPVQKPFQRTQLQDPGLSTVHWGKAHDAPPPDQRFGRVNEYTDSALELMQPKGESAFQEHMRTLLEASRPLYYNDPLGKSGSKFATDLPEKCKDGSFRFGAPTLSNGTAKEMIFPRNDPYDDPSTAVHDMYVKTHHHYDAGEQKKMGYNWLAHGIDPTSHRFGVVDRNPPERAGDVLRMEDNKQLKSTLVKKEVEDFKDVTHDALGQVKNYGFGKPPGAGSPEEQNVTFGRPNKWDDWDALRCMRGDYSAEDMSPDKSLGKSTRSLRTGYQPPQTDRPSGIPTVRHDIAKPKQKRVTDFQNYGDDVTVQRLLYPSPYAPDLVYEEDFAKGYVRDFMWDLQKSAGIGLDAQAFDTVWAKAAATYGSPDGKVSVENFRRAMSDLDL